jgi:hypothetical protein
MTSTAKWTDWYLDSLNAGRCLPRVSAIIKFAREAQQRLHEDEPEAFRLKEPVLNRRWNARRLGLKEHRTRQTLATYQLVNLLLKWASFALHATDLLTNRRSSRA